MSILTARRIFIKAVLAAAALAACAGPSLAWETRDARLSRVVDGDTFEIAGAERVRLVGVDAPEQGAPLSGESTAFLSRELSAGPLTLTVCDERDRFGRLLAVADAGSGSVNLRLLEEGLASPMLIPPCAAPSAARALEAAGRGFSASRGLYAKDRMETVAAEKASVLLGREGAVVGKVLDVGRTPKAVYLNFGPDWRADFTAVIFDQGLKRFAALGLDPADMAGRAVAVLGEVREYNGPEIEFRYPEQVLPLGPRMVPDAKPAASDGRGGGAP